MEGASRYLGGFFGASITVAPFAGTALPSSSLTCMSDDPREVLRHHGQGQGKGRTVLRRNEPRFVSARGRSGSMGTKSPRSARDDSNVHLGHGPHATDHTPCLV